MSEITVMAEPLHRPLLRRLRKDYFGSLPSTILTLAIFASLAALFWMIFNWAVLSANFSASATQQECMAGSGACWSVIANRRRIILFGTFPFDEQSRSAGLFDQ